MIADRYRVEAEMGRGGMGVVYLAHDELLDRRVAIKEVSEPGLDEKARAWLLREARLVAQLNHPNIVTIHDVVEVDGSPYIVMEYVEGKSAHVLPPHDLKQVLEVVIQLCDALTHAHELGIIHRDLKPENVLLTEDGSVKLTDFGLATSLASRVSSDGMILGTVYYVAPESVQRHPIDARTDLYALGVMLYEWCTGQLPFTASDPLAVITQLLFNPPVPPRAVAANLPADLDLLILQMLSKSPDDRPASAREVRKVLESPGLLQEEADTLAEAVTLDRMRRGLLAGRQAELQQARTVWGTVMTGRPQILFVRGEAGIGKTRLVHELIAQAQFGGAQVIQGLNDAHVAQPLGAFRQALRGPVLGRVDAWKALPEFVVADLLSLAPEYWIHFPEIPGAPAHDRAHEQERLFESFAVLLATLAAQSPVLLLIEDAQWADSGTLHLLRYLMGQLRDRPILFLLTLREESPPPSSVLPEVLLDIRRQHAVHEITLERLGREQTRAMMETFLSDNIARDLVDDIYAVTQGNPFFVEEVCKSLVSKERLIHKDNRWEVAGTQPLEIPPNVTTAIQGRVRTMSPEAKQVLYAASARGPKFEFDVLRGVEALEDGQLAEALKEAERAQIIHELPTDNGQRFEFTHTLIPSAILEGVPQAERQALHAQIAHRLEAISPDDHEALAVQYQAAGLHDEAIEHLLQAGARAFSLYACREASEHYLRAAQLQMDRQDQQAAARTLLSLGLVHSADFQFDKAQQAYEQAFELWDLALHRSDARDATVAKETLRFAVEKPLTLDPGRSGDDYSNFMVGQLFEGLVEVDEAGGVLPALAARWDVSDDGRRYIFHLRDGLRWSDGSPLIAGDIEYAWKRNLALGSQSPFGLLLSVVENVRAVGSGSMDASQLGVEAKGDQVIEVRLEAPATYFPLLVAQPETFPLPQRVVEGAEQPWTAPGVLVGNGPYLLAEHDPGQQIILERNPYYRGLARGNVRRVEAPIIGQLEPLLEAFDQGSLDGINLGGADPATMRDLIPRYRRAVRFTPTLSTLYIAFRCDRPPFHDKRVRRAFVQAVDREVVLRKTGVAQYIPATGGFLPPGMPAHSPAIGLAVDHDAARGDLAQAGFPGEKAFPAIELLYSGGQEANPLLDALRQAWKDVLGVQVQVHGVPMDELFERQNHETEHLTISGWLADYPDPDSTLRLLFHSRDGLNPIRWSNPEFDELTETAARLDDRKRRLELYRAADRILVAEQAAVMPVSYSQGRLLLKPYLQLPRSPPPMVRLKHAIVQRS